MKQKATFHAVMSKSMIVFAAAAALLAGCGKEVDTSVFKATVEPTTENGKVVYSGGRLLWSANDQISVRDASSNTAVYEIASSCVGTANGEYIKSSGADLASGPYTVVYPADIRTSANQVTLPAVQYTPDGSLHGLPMYAVSDDMNLKFYHLCGVVRFRLSATSSVKVIRIAVATNCNTNGSTSISGREKSVRISTPTGNNVTTLACCNTDGIDISNDFYMYLPAGNYSEFRILITTSDGTRCLKSATSNIIIERSKITTITLNDLSFIAYRQKYRQYPNDLTCIFAPGNYQLQPSTGTTRYAARQYDKIPLDDYNGNCHFTYASYTTYSGWFDRFCHYETYPINTTNYRLEKFWVLPSYQHPWYLPTNTELDMIKNDNSWIWATVDGVSGIIFFPIGYTHPNNVTSPTFIQGQGYPQYDNREGYSDNIYTAYDWFLMESAGCTFLPSGYYWTPATGSSGTTYYYDFEAPYYAYGFGWCRPGSYYYYNHKPSFIRGIRRLNPA
ncbi:MAG: hypothetical protein IJU81_07105 [Bacteroidales bacterium]|nr:hypothetical protein [Bacteroidales bacterium]